MRTCLEKIRRAERWRVKDGKMGSDQTAGWNGCFVIPLEGQLWQVTISDGMGWRHLSATNAQKRQLPPWEVMTRLKDLFFADEEWVTLFIPAKADYINDHPWVHHLWSPTDVEMPRPYAALV